MSSCQIRKVYPYLLFKYGHQQAKYVVSSQNYILPIRQRLWYVKMSFYFFAKYLPLNLIGSIKSTFNVILHIYTIHFKMIIFIGKLRLAKL